MRRAFLTPTIAALVACVGVPVLQAQVSEAAAEVAPLPTLAYQGRLLEGATAVSGVRSFTFSVLDSSNAELWNSGVQTLTVSEGLYSVVLGATGMPTLPVGMLAKAGLKLHVTVSGQALAPDVDIVPAFQAISAWTLAGSFSGDLGGTQNQTLVMKLQGIPLDLTTTPPTTGQALVYNGTKWVAGTVAGTAGAQGPAGPTGPTGAAGATGPQGVAGLTGATGLQGPAGPVGATGSVGPQGLPGAAGAQGVAGATGAAGAAGPVGATGSVGPQGLPGVIGAQGPVGATGATGPAGASPLTLTGADVVFTTGSLGLGTTTPSASALLDLTSTTKGFLPPRMTAVQRAAILTPTAGLMVYQTDGTAGTYQFDGSAWAKVGGAVSGGIGTVTSVTNTSGSAITIGGTATDPTVGLNQSALALTESQVTNLTSDLAAKVATSTTVNGHALSGNVTVSASDLTTGTLPHAQLPTLLSADIPANSANTSGTAAGLSATLGVNRGGTGANTLTANSVLLGNGTNALQNVAPGTSGNVLTSNGTTWISQAAGGGGAAWALGINNGALNSDGRAGGLQNIYRNGYVRINSAGDPSYPLDVSGTIRASGSLYLGDSDAYNPNFVYAGNQRFLTWFGNEGVLNYNTFLGVLAGQDHSSGASYFFKRNTGIGGLSLGSLTQGTDNTALGYNTLPFNNTGSFNIVIGSGAGGQLGNLIYPIVATTSLSYNILIGNVGVADEGNTIRIGTNHVAADPNATPAVLESGQSSTFIAGIKDTTLSGTTKTVVIDSTTGQLGAAVSNGASGTVTNVAVDGGTTGLTTSGGPVTSSGTITLGGTLAVANGGTGAATAAGARTNLGIATVGSSGAYSDLTGTPTLGTAAALSVGTSANQVVQLDGSSKLPAVDGSLLTNVVATGLGSFATANTRGGTNAMAATTGQSNTAFGTSALVLNTTSAYNSAFGANALSSYTGTNTYYPNANSAFGYKALAGLTTGSGNAAFGAGSLERNTGDWNAAMGASALASNTTGYRNTSIGGGAGQGINDGNENVAVGYNTLSQAASSVSYSVAVGSLALMYSSENYNTAIGSSALYSLARGQFNVAVGSSAGVYTKDQSASNVFLGHLADVATTGATQVLAVNRIGIGYLAKVDTDNKAVIGGDGITTVAFGSSVASSLTSVIPAISGQAMLGSGSKLWSAVYATSGVVSTSDARVKTNLRPIPSGLGTLLKLQPLTYFKHKSHFENGAVVIENDGAEEAGFIAQEVSGIIPTAVHRPEDESKMLWGMRTDQVIPYTVKAVQELKVENDALRTELETMKAELAEIKALLKL